MCVIFSCTMLLIMLFYVFFYHSITLERSVSFYNLRKVGSQPYRPLHWCPLVIISLQMLKAILLCWSIIRNDNLYYIVKCMDPGGRNEYAQRYLYFELCLALYQLKNSCVLYNIHRHVFDFSLHYSYDIDGRLIRYDPSINYLSNHIIYPFSPPKNITVLLAVKTSVLYSLLYDGSIQICLILSKI